MSHPQKFDESDPILAQVRAICSAFPGADSKISHGRPAFYTKKIFAMYGAVVKGEHHTGEFDQSIVFMPDSDEAEALSQDERFFTPAYWGPSGWMGLDLSPGPDSEGPDWDEVRELIEVSFRLTAAKKLIAELDER